MHELDMTTGRAGMAYIGDTPWHGLGTKVSPDTTPDEWRIAAGLDWAVHRLPVQFTNPVTAETEAYKGRVVLARNDSGKALSIVSDGYHVVQPKAAIDFYSDLIADAGFRMHTAGSVHEGRHIWGLAEVGESVDLGGVDRVEGYLLLSTSYDGTRATTATYTTVRVVCQNTLNIAMLRADGDAVNTVRIPHNVKFNPDEVKARLGIAGKSFACFSDEAQALTQRRVSEVEAVNWLVRVLGDPNKTPEEQQNVRAIKHVYELFSGRGKGSGMPTANGTAWGLVNAVTQYVDHERGRSPNTRLASAWFGEGRKDKADAWAEAIKLVA